MLGSRRHKCSVISRHHSLPRLFTDLQFIGVALAAHVRASSKYEIVSNVQTFDNYSIYGHLDYAVRYCPSGEAAFRFSDYADVFEAILKTIIEHGKGIEINTGSLYKNMTYAHPHPSILKLYKELGGEIITVGSDAHVPKYIGYDFETYARDILTATGFRSYCTFEQMKPVFHKL